MIMVPVRAGSVRGMGGGKEGHSTLPWHGGQHARGRKPRGIPSGGVAHRPCRENAVPTVQRSAHTSQILGRVLVQVTKTGPVQLQCSIDLTTTGVRPPIFLHGNEATWTNRRRSPNPGTVASGDRPQRYPRSAPRNQSINQSINHARTSWNLYSGSLSGSSKMPLRGD